MNLSQLLSMAGSILDYSPDVPSYRAELRRFINQAYKELFSNDVWLFAQREDHIDIYPDVSVTDIEINASGDTVVLFDPVNQPFEPWMTGAVVEITASSAPFTNFFTLPVELQVRAYINKNTLILETKDGQDIPPGAGGSTGVTATIKQRFIDMPLDCVDVLSVTLRYPSQERQPFYNLTRWEDEAWMLNMDLVARPTNFVLAEDVMVPAPVIQPTLNNLGAVVNTVPGAGDWDVVYVHQVGPENTRLSAPSPNSTVVTFAATDGMSVSGMQNNGTDNSSALRKKVYVRSPDSDAFYEALSVPVLESVTTAGSPAGLLISPAYQLPKYRMPEHEGIYKRIRMYPRQDEELTITVRYLARPRRLLDDGDVPSFPPEYHQLLVFRCCEQLFIKHGNGPLAELYRERAEAVLARMQKRYKTTRSQMLVKGNFMQSTTMARPWRTLRHLT